MPRSNPAYSLSRMGRQIGALPMRLQLWLAWLVVATLVIPLLFLPNAFFEAFLVCQLCNVVFGTVLGLRYGLVKLLSLSHLLFWTPMLAKFVWYYPSLESVLVRSVAWVVIATVAVSLVLDARDYLAWRAGDRTPVG